VPAYDDARGLERWIGWFADTVHWLHPLLADGGSLYVHLDAHVAHYAKVVLDEVFGVQAFQREIIWRIGWVSGYKSRARGWIRNHDTLLFYAKGGRPRTFHKETIPYPPGYVRRDGAPPRGLGYPVEDVWNGSSIDRLDSIQIVSFSGEKNGYPTQKNEALLARIVRASSDPGDVVLDCFCGSGTSALVAEKLGRRWVACDIAPIAIHATRKRLLTLPRARPFVVQRTGIDGALRHPGAMAIAAKTDGRRVAVEVTSFDLGDGALAEPARAGVSHWSQWLEGWCVDWDHQGGALRAQSRVWRAPRAKVLPLVTTHEYERPGRYVAHVKAFDVLGGSAVAEIPVVV
jgi:DNA modification methylase